MTLRDEVETILRRALRIIRRPWRCTTFHTKITKIRTHKAGLCPLQVVTGRGSGYKEAALKMGYSLEGVDATMLAVSEWSAEFFPLALRILRNKRIGRQAR